MVRTFEGIVTAVDLEVDSAGSYQVQLLLELAPTSVVIRPPPMLPASVELVIIPHRNFLSIKLCPEFNRVQQLLGSM